VAQAALERLTVAVLRRALEEREVEGKATVLGRLAEIHQRYVASVDVPETSSMS
jgi:hypothetical protein